MRKSIQFIFAISTLFLFQSCEGDRFEKKISTYGDDESHNAGENCMACHSKIGGVEGWFEAAGTVYDPSFSTVYPNMLVELYTGANGTGDLKYSIEGDAKGNFYTTKKIKFKDGLYPSITGDGGTKHMSSPITTGNCMSCHGNTTSHMWVD